MKEEGIPSIYLGEIEVVNGVPGTQTHACLFPKSYL